MPDGSGLDILTVARERSAQTEVIVMTAHGALETAIDAMQRGAYDFITKPFANSELRALVNKAFEKRALVAENEALRARVDRDHPRDVLGHSEAMRRIDDLVRRIASSRTTVLITGDSGTGKERIARAIHEPVGPQGQAVPRGQLRRDPGDAHRERAVRPRQGRVHRRDVAAPRALSRGRWRHGAARRGRRAAHGDAGEAPARPSGAQGARASARRRGGASTFASSRRRTGTSKRWSKAGTFRQDLYYRLNVIRIEVPPLRERASDIAALAQYFLAQVRGRAQARRSADSPPTRSGLSTSTTIRATCASWRTSSSAPSLSSPALSSASATSREISGAAAQTTPALVELPDDGCNLDDVLGEVERRIVLQALERTGGVERTRRSSSA